MWLKQFVTEEFEWYNQISMEIWYPRLYLGQPSLGDEKLI